MTTGRKPTSGRGSGDRADSINARDTYEKSSRASASGNFMKTFARTKTSQLVTAWDDESYLVINGLHLMAISDLTGDVDSATVGDPGMLALLDKAWEIYFTNANLKDLEASEELAWKTYFCAAFQICFDIQVQYNFRTLLPAYIESNVTPGAASAIPYFDQDAFDTFVNSMTNVPIPKGIDALVKTFATWVVQLAAGYERYSLRIPPSYFVPFNSYYDLANLETLRDLILKPNLGNTITHAKKFGLGMSKWADPIAPTVKMLNDVDVIAYLNHAPIRWYDNQPATSTCFPDGGFQGSNLTTEYTNVEYFFKDTPNESVLHVLAVWFGVYNATNNPYGGLFIGGATDAAEYETAFMGCSEHGTAVSGLLMSADSAKAVLALHKCYDDANSAIWKVNLDGTNFTAAQDMAGTWKLALHNNLYMGKSRGATETNNDIINYIGKLIT